ARAFVERSEANSLAEFGRRYLCGPAPIADSTRSITRSESSRAPVAAQVARATAAIRSAALGTQERGRFSPSGHGESRTIAVPERSSARSKRLHVRPGVKYWWTSS